MKKALYGGTILVMSLLLVGCASSSKVGEGSLEVETPAQSDLEGVEPKHDYPTVGLNRVSLEIVDELYNSDPSVQEWVNSLKEEKGVYIQSDETHDLLLLASGPKSTTGYGMAFVDAKASDSKVYIVYSLISPDEASTEAGQVLEQTTYPFMLLRLPKQSGEIIPYYLEESQIGDYMVATYLEDLEAEAPSEDPLLDGQVIEEIIETETTE